MKYIHSMKSKKFILAKICFYSHLKQNGRKNSLYELSKNLLAKDLKSYGENN